MAAAAALAAAALLPASPGRAAAGDAALRVAGLSPLRVAGSGFRDGERVRVQARAGSERQTHRARASSSGRFQVRFGGVHYDRCGSPLVVAARGSRGSRATLKLPAIRCPPVHDPGPDAR